MMRGQNAPPLLFGFGEEYLKPSYLIACVEEASFERSKISVKATEVYKDVDWEDTSAHRKRYAALLWTFPGATADGWRLADEEK